MKILLFSLAAALVLWAGSRSGLRAAPLINDITTTPDDPPRYRKIAEMRSGNDYAYPAAFAAVQKKGYPDLAPLKLPLSPDQAFAKVAESARAMPRWRIVSEDAKAGVLEAVASTRIMRYKDDVVIEVRPDGKGAAVHMRSKSRLGKGDLGANAARIRRFFEALAAVK
jgi:uncharacterized protein (DUF1499 family)